MGVYAGVLFKKWSFIQKVFFFFIMSFFIEAIQFIFKAGAADITDIITNTLGGIFGLLMFIGIDKLFKERIKAQKLINTVGAIGTALLITLLVLLKMNLLPVRYK
jgi:glycopeptide antibiotics resistance protein